MKVLFFRLPIRLFWSVIAVFFIVVNIGVYLYNGYMIDSTIPTLTGYSANSWEKLVVALKEFYLVGF